MAFDIPIIVIFLILSLLSVVAYKVDKEWFINIICFLWSCYIIYMLCFKNGIYD